MKLHHRALKIVENYSSEYHFAPCILNPCLKIQSTGSSNFTSAASIIRIESPARVKSSSDIMVSLAFSTERMQLNGYLFSVELKFGHDSLENYNIVKTLDKDVFLWRLYEITQGIQTNCVGTAIFRHILSRQSKYWIWVFFRSHPCDTVLCSLINN